MLSLYVRRPRLQNNVGTKPIGRCDVGVAAPRSLAFACGKGEGLFGRLDEGQFARIFINAYRAPENTELVAELQKRGWAFMDAVILDCTEIIPTLERMGVDLEQSRYAEYLSK